MCVPTINVPGAKIYLSIYLFIYTNYTYIKHVVYKAQLSPDGGYSS